MEDAEMWHVQKKTFIQAAVPQISPQWFQQKEKVDIRNEILQWPPFQ